MAIKDVTDDQLTELCEALGNKYPDRDTFLTAARFRLSADLGPSATDSRTEL